MNPLKGTGRVQNEKPKTKKANHRTASKREKGEEKPLKCRYKHGEQWKYVSKEKSVRQIEGSLYTSSEGLTCKKYNQVEIQGRITKNVEGNCFWLSKRKKDRPRSAMEDDDLGTKRTGRFQTAHQKIVGKPWLKQNTLPDTTASLEKKKHYTVC